jgi:cysteine desulfurase
MINLDANASYSLDPRVREELFVRLGRAGNPSSIHAAGQRARALVEEARESLGALVDLGPGDRIIFTSGATEANVWALTAPFFHSSFTSANPLLVTTAIEHPSVLEAAHRVRRWGHKVAVVPPTPQGAVTPDSVAAHCTSDTRMVSVMYANNETGAMQPIEAITREVRRTSPRAVLHTDAVQCLGKAPLSFRASQVDLMSLSGHKIVALSGVGALVVRRGAEPDPLLVGGAQETYSRAGTENVAGIVSFGIAAAVLRDELDSRIAAMARSRWLIQSEITRRVPGAVLRTPAESLVNTISITVPHVRADDLVVALDLRGISVSSGAACASGKPQPSHVLTAMGLSEEEARRTLRISVEHSYPEGVLHDAIDQIVSCIYRMHPAPSHTKHGGTHV